MNAKFWHLASTHVLPMRAPMSVPTRARSSVLEHARSMGTVRVPPRVSLLPKPHSVIHARRRRVVRLGCPDMLLAAASLFFGHMDRHFARVRRGTRPNRR